MNKETSLKIHTEGKINKNKYKFQIILEKKKND
jgi:hypothetical protein